MKERVKRIKKLSRKEQEVILFTIKKLLSGDTHGLDIKPLKGKSGLWRLRVGTKRMLFKKNKNGSIEIVGGGTRGNIYKSQ